MKFTIQAGKQGRAEELGDGILSSRRCLPPAQSVVFDPGSLFLNSPSEELRLAPETLVGFRVADGQTQMAAAGGLVNGASIRRERWPRRVGAILVEAQHPIALCGVWLGAVEQLSIAEGTVWSGPSILRWAQAGVDWAPSDAGVIQFITEGYKSEPFPSEVIDGDLVLRCRLAGHAHWVRVVSPALRPPGHGEGDLEQRRFGIAVTSLAVDAAPIRLDDPALVSGFYPIEGDAPRQWRWTNGNGLIALMPSASERILSVRFTNWHEMLAV